jgi:hypothetical protein
MKLREFMTKQRTAFHIHIWATVWVVFSAILASANSFADAPSADSKGISVVWSAAGAPSEHAIRTWSAKEIVGLKHTTIREKAAETGPTLSWQGPLLSEFIKESMKELPLSQQASVDLLVFRSRTGSQVAIPRWLVTRYPVLLGTQKKGDHRSFQVVLPWTSHPAIRKENVPVRAYGIADVVSIELSSYDQAYHSFYLKKRNDPVAMKGEKLFVQNCTSCHSVAEPKFSISDLAVSPRTRQLASQGHPVVPDAPKLSESDVRALTTYLDAFKNESSASAPASAHNP